MPFGISYQPKAGIYTQSTPSAVWTINHNRGEEPAVQLRTLGGLVMHGEVLHLSADQTTITFTTPTAGTARLN